MIGRMGVVLLAIAMIAGCGADDEEAAAGNSGAPKATIAAAIGDAGGPLVGLTWVKGEPVQVGGGEVTVIEFWATWCPPCRESIPHLTELQAKYKDRGVVVLGVSTEAEATVRPFVENMGPKMDYRVAIDTQGQVWEGYMGAFKQSGIPTAFLVDGQGSVIWHGHPAVLEPVLKEAVSAAEAVVAAQ